MKVKKTWEKRIVTTGYKIREKGYCDIRKILTLKKEEKEVKYKIGELTGSQQKRVEELLRKNEDIFIKGKYEVEKTNVVKYTIDTGDEKLTKQRQEDYQ